MGHIETPGTADTSYYEQKEYLTVSFMGQLGQALIPVAQPNTDFGLTGQVFYRCG